MEENPFNTGLEVVPSNQESTSALVEVEQQRAIAETQAAMIIAKRFPRNQAKAMDRILNACTRPGLADAALYQYARGGTEITGPSIRLAEAIAQNWENLQFGVREIDQKNGASTVEAFAWDVETNVRQVKIFQVAHKRHTKKGSYKLEDPRDIYEMIANQGARRLRACILGIIPGDVIESATRQCEATLKIKADVTPERIASLLDKFGEMGITKQQIEKRIQRRIDAITPALMVNLGKIYNSMKDGMSVPADWFEVEKSSAQRSEPAATGNESLKSKLTNASQPGNGDSGQPAPATATLEELIGKARPKSGQDAKDKYLTLIMNNLENVKNLQKKDLDSAKGKWLNAEMGPWPLDPKEPEKVKVVTEPVVPERNGGGMIMKDEDLVYCPNQDCRVGVEECESCASKPNCPEWQA